MKHSKKGISGIFSAINENVSLLLLNNCFCGPYVIDQIVDYWNEHGLLHSGKKYISVRNIRSTVFQYILTLSRIFIFVNGGIVKK